MACVDMYRFEGGAPRDGAPVLIRRFPPDLRFGGNGIGRDRPIARSVVAIVWGPLELFGANRKAERRPSVGNRGEIMIAKSIVYDQ
jgi:hypothetical protein